MIPPVPTNEAQRLEELAAFDILDTLPEQAYDDITYLASTICGTPIALMTLVDNERQWFKSRVGLGVPETPREHAFCAHAIASPRELMEVADAANDVRFADNPLVTGDPNIRFYAGAPLVTPTGSALGTLCVIDRVPRTLTREQRDALIALSRQVMAQLELRRTNQQLVVTARENEEYALLLADYQLQLEVANDRLARDSITDGLTGLVNRRELDRILQEEWDRSTRHQTPISVALIDLDRFKNLNDRLGHAAGDKAIRETAAAFDRARRSTDLLARYGGEEFLLVLPGTPIEGALVMGERLRRALRGLTIGDRTVTASFGVAARLPEMLTVDDLVAAADGALYRAKAEGRDRVVRAADP